MSSPTSTGQSQIRFEDPKLVSGLGSYLEDLTPEHTLHLLLVRSPYAHAAIENIDLEAAQALPGIAAVYTARDLPDLYTPATGPKDARGVPHPALAREAVRYMGQPVVAILAHSLTAAHDAAQLVWVDYQPLEALPHPLAAIDGPAIHPGHESNVALRRKTSSGQEEVDRIFAQAAHLVGQPMVQQRVAPSSLEGRGTLAAWDGTQGSLTVWSSTQVPHGLRTGLARTLNLAENQIRVIAPDVGGAFGAKLNVYPEDVLVAHLARHHRRPVKWVERRSEGFQATIHGRGQVAQLEMALDAQGQILALRGRIIADLGAYLLDTTTGPVSGTVFMLPGAYRVPAFHVEVLGVYTHATPTAAYRGAGRPEATYYIERLMDMAAFQLGLDPAEIRRRNLIEGPFPYKTITGATYDSGNYPQALELLLEKTGYALLRQQQAQARQQGRLIGLGLTVYTEITGFGWETGVVRIHPDGSAVVYTGTVSQGQGNPTTYAQIVASRLGIEASRVQVVLGDTQTVHFGQGTGGSRTLMVGGSAILNAANVVRDKCQKIAAHLLEAAPEDLELTELGWTVVGTDRAVGVKEVAQTAYNPRKLPPFMEPGLEGLSTFNLKESNYPFGAHLAQVEVDPQTGQVTLLNYTALDDCGTVFNPLLVDGQVHGGIAQGLGQALYEGIVLDESGQNITGSFLEYTFPRADQLGMFTTHRTHTPSPTNPLGAKGIGEAGTIAATPAVVNAVLDALGQAHLDMPLTPEKVWRSLKGQG